MLGWTPNLNTSVGKSVWPLRIMTTPRWWEVFSSRNFPNVHSTFHQSFSRVLIQKLLQDSHPVLDHRASSGDCLEIFSHSAYDWILFECGPLALTLVTSHLCANPLTDISLLIIVGLITLLQEEDELGLLGRPHNLYTSIRTKRMAIANRQENLR